MVHGLAVALPAPPTDAAGGHGVVGQQDDRQVACFVERILHGHRPGFAGRAGGANIAAAIDQRRAPLAQLPGRLVHGPAFGDAAKIDALATRHSRRALGSVQPHLLPTASGRCRALPALWTGPASFDLFEAAIVAGCL